MECYQSCLSVVMLTSWSTFCIFSTKYNMMNMYLLRSGKMHLEPLFQKGGEISLVDVGGEAFTKVFQRMFQKMAERFCQIHNVASRVAEAVLTCYSV